MPIAQKREQEREISCSAEVDEYPAQAVHPAVLNGQPHPVRHQAAECRGLQGELTAEEGLGDTIEAEFRRGGGTAGTKP